MCLWWDVLKVPAPFVPLLSQLSQASQHKDLGTGPSRAHQRRSLAGRCSRRARKVGSFEKKKGKRRRKKNCARGEPIKCETVRRDKTAERKKRKSDGLLPTLFSALVTAFPNGSGLKGEVGMSDLGGGFIFLFLSPFFPPPRPSWGQIRPVSAGTHLVRPLEVETEL